MKAFDALVLGLGALGSAVLLQLARRGIRVLGVDRLAPPHTQGSSHGETRITRCAIGEGEHFTPLALRSHVLWREIESETGAKLLTTRGVLVLSSPARTSFTHVENFFANTVAAARKYHIAHEILDAEAIRRRYIELRYQLLPYIYTGIEATTRTGLPFMRPVFLDYPSLDVFNDRDFLFGSDLFVAPVTTETLDAQEIQLPPGDWYDYWTSQKHLSTEKIALHPALDELPLYVRAGAIIPMQPVVQNTEEKPIGPLEIKIYAGDNCRGSLYEDDGHTFAYQRGEFRRTSYTCQVSGGSIEVIATTEKNTYRPWWHAARITIIGIPGEPKELRLGQKTIRDWHYDAKSHSVIVSVPDALQDWNIHLVM